MAKKKKKLETVSNYENRRTRERRQMRISAMKPSGLECPSCSHELLDEGLVYEGSDNKFDNRVWPVARRLVCPDCELERKVSM